MTHGKNAAIAAAVAGLFALGTGAAFAADSGAATEKVKCEGANSCKGHSECKTAKNDCAGKNGCGGQGYMMMTPAECEAAKAKLKEKAK